MKEMLTTLLNSIGLAHWVKIISDDPQCTYYFGPFLSLDEAHTAQAGYVEDILGEGAKVVKIETMRCKPHTLTIYDETQEIKNLALSAYGG